MIFLFKIIDGQRNLKENIKALVNDEARDGLAPLNAKTCSNKTASFQKEAMCTQVALWFFIKWNLNK